MPRTPIFVPVRTYHSPRRLEGIDSARGAAMVLVCLSHFGFEYFRPFQDVVENQAIRVLTMIASPTFMLISGMMLGLLHRTRPKSFGDVSHTLLGRGIFLLTIGHALIVISCIPRMGGLGPALTRGFITDAIGIAIILGPMTIQRVGVGGRLALALGLYLMGTALGIYWHPAGDLGDVARYVLSGPGEGDDRYNFPLLAWLAVYLVGTTIGGRIGDLYKQGRAAQAEASLFAGGVGLAAAGAGVKGLYVLLRGAGMVDGGVGPLYALTSPLTKLPPSPAYLLFYGGCGLAMTGALLFAYRRRIARPAITWLGDLGRASLFVFLLQFYVYYVGFYYLALDYSPLWPLYFVASVALISITARWWVRHGLNKVFDMTRWFQRAPREAGAPTGS